MNGTVLKKANVGKRVYCFMKAIGKDLYRIQIRAGFTKINGKWLEKRKAEKEWSTATSI
jgi:hypothetical protein